MPKAFPERASAVVIGGGVTGASVAYHLAKLGWTDVLLLERKQFASGTSWQVLSDGDLWPAGRLLLGSFPSCWRGIRSLPGRPSRLCLPLRL